jgi:hypothetical protein
MASCAKLLEAARNNPAGLRFAELCKLAECHGWRFSRQRGSHRSYVRDGTPRPLTFQDYRGAAKAYQVRQLLDAIDVLGESPDLGENE